MTDTGANNGAAIASCLAETGEHKLPRASQIETQGTSIHGDFGDLKSKRNQSAVPILLDP